MKEKILKLYLPVLLALAACCGIVAFSLSHHGKHGKREEIIDNSISSQDTTAPVITIDGASFLEMVAGETIHLPEATASDDVEGDITENISQKLSHGTTLAELEDGHFTTNVGGVYKVIYYVSDEAGNEAMETVEINVATKTPEKELEGNNDLNVLNTSGALFYENFEKGPENELLYDNFQDFYTLTGMEDAISGNSLVVDYGSATTTNRVMLLSLVPYLQSGTWEISFDVKLASGKTNDDFYIMYTPDVDKNIYYSERLMLADMKEGEVRHISYKKVLEVLEHQEGTATFFLCNSNLDCGDITLMFDNFQIKRTDLEHETYIPTVTELEKGFTYDWSDKKYATLGEVMNVNDIKDAEVREALKGKEGFSNRVMKLTNDSVLNGILAANNSAFYEQGREYIIEINYYAKECQNSALMAFSSSANGRGIRENLFIKRNETDSVTVRYRIGRGEEEMAFYLFGYPSEVYIGDITLKLQDRTDIDRNDYHMLTEAELYKGYTFDFSENNLPMLSSQLMYIGHYKTETLSDILPEGYFRSGYTTWINGQYELNLDFLNGLLKPGRTYDVTFRFYADRDLEMDKLFLLTKNEQGIAEEKNRWGLTDLGDGMYELYTQFMIEDTETTAMLYAQQILSIYLDSIDVSMQDTKPIVELDKGIKKDYRIDFDDEWLRFSVKNSNAGYAKTIPSIGECGMYVDLCEVVYFPQLCDFTKGRTYVITFTTENAGSFGQPVAMFVDKDKVPTETYVYPVKAAEGHTVTYQYIFTADETTKMFALLNATPKSRETMYITEVDIFSKESDTTSSEEICSEKGYVSDFDNALPALKLGQWTTDLPSKYKSSQKYFYHIDLQNSEAFAMDFSIFDGLVKKGYYYELSMTGFLEEDSDVDVRLLPMDEKGNYTTYTAVREKQSDGQTKINFYFNGGDYDTGRICEYLRLYSISGKNRKFDMYISQIAMKAVDYNTVKTGTLDTGVNKIIFPNIYEVSDYSGNAQSIIILNNGKVALIDAGEMKSETGKFTLYKKLKELGVKKIDTVIMTHPHSDHVGAFTLLTEYFDIGSFYCKNTCFSCYDSSDGGQAMTEQYNTVLNSMKKKVNSDKSKVQIITDVKYGDKISFGKDGEFVFYYAKECFGEELASGISRQKWDGNYFSLAVRYNTASGYDSYFAGDSIDLLEGDLLKTQFENCEIWQINHHGSDGPYTTNRMIALIDPEYAVVCGTTDNLKENVKKRIESFGDIEIKYPSKGDIIFDLNSLTPERDYKTLTEAELYAGHTFDLSANNMPYVTTNHSEMDLRYVNTKGSTIAFPSEYFVNDTAIQADGRYMVNLEFLNGLIQKGRTYDLNFTVYAPDRVAENGTVTEGISKAVTYLEVKGADGKAYSYDRFGFKNLGNGMYELYIQVSCKKEESVFSLYSDTDQAFYIEKIAVSMRDSKPFAEFEEGVTGKHEINLNEKWLEFSVRNSNAGYRKIPGTDTYALYAKINEILCFKQLTGLAEGLDYQVAVTAKYDGDDSSSILGMFFNENLEQSGNVTCEPEIRKSGDTITYTFPFTADATTKTFGLYDRNHAEEELYITNVKILSENTDKITLEEISSQKGYRSSFDELKPVLRYGDWVSKTDIPSSYAYSGVQENFYHIDLAAATGNMMDFTVFNGMVKKGYYYTLSITGFLNGSGDNAYLLPMSEGANYTTYSAVSETLSDGQTKLTYYFNGGDYYGGKECEILRLFGKNGANTVFDMYISEIAMNAVDYRMLQSGSLDKTANKIIFPNVYQVDDYSGNAESVIILNHGKVALIDAGERRSETSKFVLLKKLRELGIEKIDVVIMTHPHSDHYGAFTMLAEYFDIGAYYCKDTEWEMYESAGNGPGMKEYFDAIAQCMKDKVNSDGSHVMIDTDVDFGQKVDFGDGGEFIFYYAKECFGEGLAEGETRKKWDGNYFSLGIRYNTKNGYDAYFAGDSASFLEGDLLTNPFDNCEIWQINHHGSSGPYTTDRLLALLDPEYAVVCGTKDNLKNDIKTKLENYGGITICYGADGEQIFDLNKLTAERSYRSISKQDLEAAGGYTYTLSADNMPRITSSNAKNLEVVYLDKADVSGYPEEYKNNFETIMVKGQTMAYLEFMNGLVEPGFAYDVKFRVYAPNGVSKNDVYLEAKNQTDRSLYLRRVGFNDLGNGMYEFHGQLRCQTEESQITLYLGTNQTYYIDEVSVSRLSAKGYASLDQGIIADHKIDFSENWLDVTVVNSIAGYKLIPDTSAYGLYTKLEQNLIFEGLSDFTEGRTYQIAFKAKPIKNCGQLYGLSYGTTNTTLASAIPVNTEDGSVTYAFTFTASEGMGRFGLYHHTDSAVPEMYIQSVEITSYVLDTVTSEQVNSGNGYTSDFANKRLALKVNSPNHVNYVWDETEGTMDVTLKNGGGFVFTSFDDILNEADEYCMEIILENKLSTTNNFLLLPANSSSMQTKGNFSVSQYSGSNETETICKFVFTLSGAGSVTPNNIMIYNATGSELTMSVKEVRLYKLDTEVSDTMYGPGGYVSDFTQARLNFVPNTFDTKYVHSYWMKNTEGINEFYVKQTNGGGFNLSSFTGTFTAGAKYYLELEVEQLRGGSLLLLPFNSSGQQGSTINVSKSEDGSVYKAEFIAMTDLQRIMLYCTGGTNEMKIKRVSLRGFDLTQGATVMPTEKTFKCSGGQSAVTDEETGILTLKMMGTNGTTNSFSFDMFDGLLKNGKKYRLTMSLTSDDSVTANFLHLMGKKVENDGFTSVGTVKKNQIGDTLVYQWDFTAAEAYRNLKLYCSYATTSTAVMKMEIKSVTLQEVDEGSGVSLELEEELNIPEEEIEGNTEKEDE